MKIFYTHNAIRDLMRLRDFIAKNNPEAAFNVSEKLKQAISRLVDFPMLGKQVKSSENLPSLREFVSSKYVIRYMLLENEIHILRIWHGKENWMNLSANANY